MNYFGTDGIRGIVGEKIDDKLLVKAAKGIVKFYTKHNLKKVILVGNDSRKSSDYILATMQQVFLKFGISVHNVGLCSTPCLAYLARTYNYPLAMMISASHNPSEYNGIKFFNNLGEKITTEQEAEIEAFMDSPFRNKQANYANMQQCESLKHCYINFLKGLLKQSTNAIFDCSNGGTSYIARSVFKNNHIIFNKPNGTNINQNCGCTHMENLQLECKKLGKIGFAFDGNGDRVLAVDEDGNIIDGNLILFIFAKFFLTYGDVVVGTKNTNQGLNDALSKRKIKLIRANVGDKNVYQEMKQNNAIVGGEECGHIIYKTLTNTGDGLVTAITLINILNTSKLTFKELINGYTSYFEARKNLSLTREFKTTKTLTDLIRMFENQGSRIVVRPSGTEPVLRLLVENKSEQTATTQLNLLVDAITKDL